jgi:hypothetical protein
VAVGDHKVDETMRTIIDLPDSSQEKIEAHIEKFRVRHFERGGTDEGIWIRSGKWKGRGIRNGTRLCGVEVRKPDAAP